MAFLIWAHEKTIDELIELFDLCLANAFRKSKRELKEFQLQHMARMQLAFNAPPVIIGQAYNIDGGRVMS